MRKAAVIASMVGLAILAFAVANLALAADGPDPGANDIPICPETDVVRGYSSPEEAEAALQAYEEKWGEAGPGRCRLDPAGLATITQEGVVTIQHSP